MSRSNPNLKNPAARFFQWRGGADDDGKGGYVGGKVNYYDKETQQSIDVKLPFTFLVLDELNTVSGYCEPKKSSYYSNEVRNITKDVLTVKTGGGGGSQSVTEGRGTWAELAELKGRGAKYAKSVYIAFKDETGEFAIGNIKIMGAALTAWIEFQKKYNVEQCAVLMEVDPEVKTKGKTKYFMPHFDAREVSAETDAEAKKLDDQLQDYLSSYFNRDPDTDPKYASSTEELDEKDESADPSEQPGTPVPAQEPAPAPKAAPADDGTIPLKDIPF